LDLFQTAFRGTVRSQAGNLMVELPRHVAQALALVHEVPGRMRGVSFQAVISRDEPGGAAIAVPSAVGLGDGERCDVYMGN
jgi:hypothetical protein